MQTNKPRPKIGENRTEHLVKELIPASHHPQKLNLKLRGMLEFAPISRVGLARAASSLRSHRRTAPAITLSTGGTFESSHVGCAYLSHEN
jgi:hypothetical protein